MKKLLFSGIVFAAMSSAALAAEPLTEKQMDTVTAGQVNVAGPYLSVAISGNLNSTTGLDAAFSTATFFVVSND
jgi:hypothetical protein